MNPGRRIAALFRARANKALVLAEDLREMQPELLARVRRGVADVTVSRRRIELQLAQLQQPAANLESQAQQRLAIGRRTRGALTRRAAVTAQVGDPQGQQASLQPEQDKAHRRPQARGRGFGSKRTRFQLRLPC